MDCILNAFELFKTNTCQVTVVSVVAFLLGAVAMCLVCKCKARCSCGRAQGAGAKPGDTNRVAKKPEERPFEKRKPHPAPADGSIEIYVGNLSYDMTEDQLRKEFEAYGTVNSARLIINKFNGKSKGFGFVHMPNREEAEKACAALNDKEILGRRMKCNEAKNLI